MVFQGVELTAYTSRKVSQLGELYITYNLTQSRSASSEQRQDYFITHWDFMCECEKCNSREPFVRAYEVAAAELNTLELEHRIQTFDGQWSQQYGAWVDAYLQKISQTEFY